MIKKYSVNIISDKDIWNRYLDEFEDANIYQTWNYAATAKGEKLFEHVAIFSDDTLIGIAQVRLKIMSVIKRGIAYIYRGPLWQKKNQKFDFNVLQDILEILRQEYAVKRKLLLRVLPYVFSDLLNDFNFELNSNFRVIKSKSKYMTIMLDLDQDLDDIKKGFRRKWRQELNKALKNDLKIISGTSPDLYAIFKDVYRQMHARKGFKEYVSVDKFGKANEALDDDFKLNIFIVMRDNVPVASFLGSSIGRTGIALLGGVNEAGMKCGAAYRLQWEMIRWLKSRKCKNYDLGGIDPIKNYGSYVWKTGISKNEVQELGLLECYESRFSKSIVTIAEKIKKSIS